MFEKDISVNIIENALISQYHYIILYFISFVSVRRPPSIIVSPIERKIYSINVGGPLQLDCIADGSPKPELVCSLK